MLSGGAQAQSTFVGGNPLRVSFRADGFPPPGAAVAAARWLVVIGGVLKCFDCEECLCVSGIDSAIAQAGFSEKRERNSHKISS